MPNSQDCDVVSVDCIVDCIVEFSTHPKRRFWKEEQKMNATFRITFQGLEYSIWAKNHWKSIRRSGFHEMRIFEAPLTHNPSKTDECPPNIYRKNVCILTVNLGKRLLDGFGNVCECSMCATSHCSVSRKRHIVLLFLLPKSSFGRVQVYAPQTKIWEGRTSVLVCLFDAHAETYHLTRPSKIK